jgi:hypothetical protein
VYRFISSKRALAWNDEYRCFPASIRLGEPALTLHLCSGFLDYQVGVAIGQTAPRILLNACTALRSVRIVFSRSPSLEGSRGLVRGGRNQAAKDDS